MLAVVFNLICLPYARVLAGQRQDDHHQAVVHSGYRVSDCHVLVCAPSAFLRNLLAIFIDVSAFVSRGLPGVVVRRPVNGFDSSSCGTRLAPSRSALIFTEFSLCSFLHDFVSGAASCSCCVVLWLS